MGRGRSKSNGGGGGFGQALSDTVSNEEWTEFARKFGRAITSEEEKDLAGYVRTSNSFEINKKLFTDGEGIEALSDKDKRTTDTLDKVIESHHTPKDASFTRYSSKEAIQAILGLTPKQMEMLQGAPNYTPEQMANLNKAIKGNSSFSKSFTSTSARKEHLFSGWYPFRRQISVKKGTQAFACNPDETEVIFGRNMKTVVDGVSWDGKHIVIHEHFVGYGK